MRIEPELPTNLKYRRLKTAVGDIAMECLVTIWAHCQQNQRGEYWPGADADYVEMLCNWTGQRGELFRALVDCGKPGKVGFIVPDEGGVLIHEWNDMNSQMVGNWNRNLNGRAGRSVNPTVTRRGNPTGSQREASDNPTVTPTVRAGFRGEPQIEGQNGVGLNGQTPLLAGTETGSNDVESGSQREASANHTGNRTGNPTGSQRTVRPVSLSSLYSEATNRITLLNLLTGAEFNPPIPELEQIVARLQETDGDFAGVDAMIRRQVTLWKDDPKCRHWLKPGTLFGANFHDYYGQRFLPAVKPAPVGFGKNRAAQTDRTEMLETLSAIRGQLEKNPDDAGLMARARELELQTA